MDQPGTVPAPAAKRPLARLMMCGAIVLHFVSQFFLYFNDQPEPFPKEMTNFTVYGMNVYGDGIIATGWPLHPQAYAILAILALLFFRDDFEDTPVFAWFGYWAAAALMVWAAAPGAPFRDAPGAAMGGIAVLIALAAAVVNIVERRKVKAAMPPSPNA